MADTEATDVRRALRAELKAQMSARDRLAVAALRIAIASIDNAEAWPVDDENGPWRPSPTGPEVERRTVTDDEARGLVTEEVDDLLAAAGRYDELGRADRADEARHQAGILRSVLDRLSSPGTGAGPRSASDPTP